MNDMRYHYCDNDLLENKQNYQMSQFKGHDFLMAYIGFREQIIKKLAEKKLILSENDLVTKLNLDDYKDYDTEKLEEYQTESLLSWILFHIFTQKNNTLVDHFITTFIKKFEIRKKIYSKYSHDFIESSDNFTYMRNYLLLSVICIIKYQKTMNLKFLNTALKINDILCSRTYLIENNIDSALFAYVLEKEVHHIKQMYKKIKPELKK